MFPRAVSCPACVPVCQGDSLQLPQLSPKATSEQSGGVECAVFVSALLPMTKDPSGTGRRAPCEAKRKAGGNTQN